MKIILIKDIKGTGKKDEIKEVKDGFGSFLIGNSSAVAYNTKNNTVLTRELKQREDKEQLLIEECLKQKKLIEDLSVTLTLKTGNSGKTFGSITSKQICEELKASNIIIDKKKLLIKDEINNLGQYNIKVMLHKKVTAVLHLKVVGD
ncbi:MAG: 50S ribosomal protein L9 [Bacilli bacterium]